MGLLPSWNQQNTFQQAGLGQHTMFSNPSYEQMGKPARLANALMNPQPQMQPQMNAMQPQMPYQASNQNTNLMMNQNPQMQNWNSQYQGN